MPDKILLQGMEFFGCHGIFAWEKENAQRFVIDLELTCDLKAAGEKDCLSDTVDYGAVYRVVREIVEKKRFNLLEALAHHLAVAILAQFSVSGVRLRVQKPGALVGGKITTVAVEIIREKSE
jgi:dihydroneopterin aldolase